MGDVVDLNSGRDMIKLDEDEEHPEGTVFIFHFHLPDGGCAEFGVPARTARDAYDMLECMALGEVSGVILQKSTFH